MEVKTITQGRDGCKVNGAYKLIFPIRKDYYHIRNDGTEMAYASVFSDSTDTAEDGVYDIPSGGVLSLKGHGSDTLYVSGKVTVMGTASAVCPFKIGLRGGDGYADVTATGNPVQLDGLQGGVPFSEMVVSGDNIIGQDLTVSVSGKNLIPYPYVNTTKTINGITFTDNGDGTITANGTATALANFALVWKNLHIPKGTYTISGCPKGGNVNTGFFIVCGTDSIRYAADTGNGGTFTISEDTNDFTFSIRINSGVTVDNLVFRPQLEIGTVATAYEPYHGSTNTIKPDSNPYVLSNDIRQQDGLNVVGVSEGKISVTGVQKNAAIKRIWDEIDEIKTAIIVSNGETE